MGRGVGGVVGPSVEVGHGVEEADGVIGLAVEVGLGVEKAGGAAVITRGPGVVGLDCEGNVGSDEHPTRINVIKHRKRFFAIKLFL